RAPAARQHAAVTGHALLHLPFRSHATPTLGAASMSDPFIGEIALFGFAYPPSGWAFCDGSHLLINQNQGLFSLLGTTYGGDGKKDFALPDLRGRVPIGDGSGSGLTPRAMGQTLGSEAITLDARYVPVHNHTLQGVYLGEITSNTQIPSPDVWIARPIAFDSQGRELTMAFYAQDPDPLTVTMAGAAVGITGGNPHSNQMPYATLNFCIA